jgi:hypothetical protein
MASIESHAFTHKVKRTVATLFTALENASSAFCYLRKEIPIIVESTTCASDCARESFIQHFELVFLFHAPRETSQ